LLALLGAATEQDNQRVAVSAEVDPITGTEIDPRLEHAAADSFDVGQMAKREPRQGDRHFRGRLRIEAVEPAAKRAPSGCVQIFERLHSVSII